MMTGNARLDIEKPALLAPLVTQQYGWFIEKYGSPLSQVAVQGDGRCLCGIVSIRIMAGGVWQFWHQIKHHAIKRRCVCMVRLTALAT